MAIEQGTETVTVTLEERTWRVEIFCEKGEDPTIRAHRQTVRSDAGGNLLSIVNCATVERNSSTIQGDTFTAAGVTVTGAQLADLIAAAADQWRSEDLAAVEATSAGAT
ncbi:MAG: hypothetical protein J0H71_05585 [Rhizobiales bacterium]|nr:hypothetical protein [Hyphomicrobiales bacterium]